MPNIVLANTSTHFESVRFTYAVEGVYDSPLHAIHSKLKEFKKSAPPLVKSNIHSHYLASKREIYNTLQALGYFKASIESRLEKNNNHYNATYTITLGPALTITYLNIQLVGPGQQDIALQKLVDTLSTKKGCVMSTGTYQMLKRELYTIVTAEGYLDAQWKQHNVVIDPVKYTATINLSLETGLQYKIGPVTFTKNPLSDTLLRRYIKFAEKAPYRLRDLQILKSTLKNTGYFQKTAIKIPSHPANAEIPVNVEVVPVSKNYHALRMGYNTGLGLRIKAEKQIRYLNDQGHQVSLMGEYSTARPITILGLYSIPGLLPATQHHHIQFEYNQHYLSDIPTRTFILGLLHTRQYLASTLHAFIKYHDEAFPFKVASHLKNRTYLFIPGFIAQLSKLHWLEASHNYNMHLQMQMASRIFLSEIDLFRIEYKLNYFGEYSNYSNLWKKNSYIVFKMCLGYTGIPSFQERPPSFGFYAGGLHAPRGHQEYQAYEGLCTYSLEYRHCLQNLFYLNFFADVHPQFTNNQLKYINSAGIGLSLWTPTIGIAEISLVYKNSHLFKPDAWSIMVRISDEL